MSDRALSFSLADFFFNDSPDVLRPPSDFLSWIGDPKIQEAMRLFGQQLLAAPRAGTEVMSSLDGARHKVINMTSYNYLGLSSHPEVIQAAKNALDLYGLGASGAPLLSGTFDLHVEFARRLAEFKQRLSTVL
jgi:glycine C-acetyltransferase